MVVGKPNSQTAETPARGSTGNSRPVLMMTGHKRKDGSKMKKSEIMNRAAKAAKALDNQCFFGEHSSNFDDGSRYWAARDMIGIIGGECILVDQSGKHAVALFGLPFVTAEGKLV